MFHHDLSRRQMLVRAAATAASLGLAVSLSTAARNAHAKVNPAPDKTADNADCNDITEDMR